MLIAEPEAGSVATKVVVVASVAAKQVIVREGAEDEATEALGAFWISMHEIPEIPPEADCIEPIAANNRGKLVWGWKVMVYTPADALTTDWIAAPT